MDTLSDQVRRREEAGWRERRAGLDMLVTDDVAVMSRFEFEGLAEYSSTLPSGTYLGKVWRSRGLRDWFLGEFFDDGTPGMVAIRWRRIVVVSDVGVWLASTYGECGATDRPERLRPVAGLSGTGY
jgi:hypothetical protein